MPDRATADAIQKDWKEREMIEIVHLNLLKVRIHPEYYCPYRPFELLPQQLTQTVLSPCK